MVYKKFLLILFSIIFIIGIITADTINVQFPSNYALFQRDNSTHGNITINGVYSGNPDFIEASFNGGNYVTINTSLGSGSKGFSGVLPNQLVGQGNLTVRYKNNTNVNKTLTYISVGDLYVTAGASLMSGGICGDNQFLDEDNPYLVTRFNYNDNKWILLDDIDSFLPIMASILVKKSNIPIAFIRGAVSGSDVTGFNGTGAVYYDKIIGYISNATNGTMNIRSLIYQSGGNDIGLPYMNYAVQQTALNRMANHFISNTSIATEILLAEKESRLPSSGFLLDYIKKSQSDLWFSNPNISYGGNFYDIMVHTDGVHFCSYDSLVLQSERWASSIYSHYYNTSYVGLGPRVGRVVYYNSTSVVVYFYNGTFPLLSNNPNFVRGFSLFLSNGTKINTSSMIRGQIIGDNKVQLFFTGLTLDKTELVSYASGNDAYNTDSLYDSGEYNLPVRSFWNQTILDILINYEFNENSGTTAYDSSGNGNNGTIVEATWQNDGVLVSLTEDTDFSINKVSGILTLLNPTYLFSYITASWTESNIDDSVSVLRGNVSAGVDVISGKIPLLFLVLIVGVILIVLGGLTALFYLLMKKVPSRFSGGV